MSRVGDRDEIDAGDDLCRCAHRACPFSFCALPRACDAPRGPRRSSSAWSVFIRPKISSAASCCCSRVVSATRSNRSGVAVLDGHLRELEPPPVAHLVGAEDRHRHDRGARLERQPPDPGPRLIRQLAGARAPALAVHDDRPAPLEDLERGDERLLVLMAAPHREHAAVAEDPARRARTAATCP